MSGCCFPQSLSLSLPSSSPPSLPQVYAEQYPGSLPVSQLSGKTIDTQGCGSSTDNNTDSNICYSSGGCFFGSHAENNGEVDKLYAR